jgi:hypothetical protein
MTEGGFTKMGRLLLGPVAMASFCPAPRAQAVAQAPAGVRRGGEKVYAALKKLHEDAGDAVARRDRGSLEQLYASEFIYIRRGARAEETAKKIT